MKLVTEYFCICFAICISLSGSATCNDGFNNFLAIQMGNWWDWMHQVGKEPIPIQANPRAIFDGSPTYKIFMNLTDTQVSKLGKWPLESKFTSVVTPVIRVFPMQIDYTNVTFSGYFTASGTVTYPDAIDFTSYGNWSVQAHLRLSYTGVFDVEDGFVVLNPERSQAPRVSVMGILDCEFGDLLPLDELPIHMKDHIIMTVSGQLVDNIVDLHELMDNPVKELLETYLQTAFWETSLEDIVGSTP